MHSTTGLAAGLLLAALTTTAFGQAAPPPVPPPLQRPLLPFDDGTRYLIQPPPAMRVRDYSWTYIDPLSPRLIRLHDIITVIVDEKSELTLNSTFNRQRNNTLVAELREFIRIGKRGNLDNAALNEPTIDASQRGQMRDRGQAVDQEGIRYRVAATVVNVLPNGVVVLEARKSIRSNRDLWQFTLTGKIRSQDVRRDNTALSENIADLQIVKKRAGKIYDSTKRHWGIVLYDWLWPF